MKLRFFILGVIITFSAVLFSFYPLFQDFNETDYVIPLYKSENYPNYLDLLIMNVNSNCNLSDNIFSQYTINDEPICTIAQNWVNALFAVVFIGIIVMIVSGALPSKI